MSSPDEHESAVPAQPATHLLATVIAAILTLGSLAWSADLFRYIGLVLLIEQFLAGILGLALTLVYLRCPFVRHTARTSVPWYDRIAALISFATGAYCAVAFRDLIDRMIDGTPDTIIVSTILFLLSMEALRRTTGYSLVVIVGFFVVYALVGHLIPGDFQTRDINLGSYISYLGLDSSALFGLPFVVGATVVVTFVFFGNLLMHSGGAAFFNDVSLALMGRYRGGSAKIAITASSLFGSISGVAVSNIVATGIITIPMMKKAGFSPKLAASIEAVASTGGQLMPPVMGAVAFLMADFLQLPYQHIVIAALVPAILYYVALFIQADLEAAKLGIVRVPESEIPNLVTVMKGGWVFVVPFAALIYALFFLNWRAETSALLACAAVIVVGLFVGYKGQRMRLAHIWDSLVATGNAVLDVLMIVAGAGFIIGTLQITGLGFAFTLFIVEVGGSNLLVLLLIAAVLCIILGMGMPTVGVYILLAILVAPSLVEVGVDPLAAHMFILYFGMMSLITPPVAVAAFFAASIANAPPIATGWTSMRFGWTAYVVPFLFVFSPSLLLQGTFEELIVDVSSAIAGVWLISAGLLGYFAKPLNLAERTTFLLAGILLLIPNELAAWTVWTDSVGWIVGAVIVLWNIISVRRRQAMVGAK